jgi:hypothetical protein
MENSDKIILDLCAGTGAWSEPYVQAGYDVRRITWPLFDVRTYRPPWNVYGILMAVDCTHFAGSGAQYWKAKDRDGRTLQAVLIAKSCLEIKDYCIIQAFWALENPVGRIRKLLPEIGKPQLTFNPCDYGDPYTKKTQIYGIFNQPIKNPVDPVMFEKGGKRGSWMWATLGGKSERTKELRSITPPGFARAFYEANK